MYGLIFLEITIIPMLNKSKYKIILLLIISILVRWMTANYTEFGNDEVYYRLYALYPDFSHFDHPPFLGWLIQAFTLNLHYSSEVAIRFASIVLGTLNTVIIYSIGKSISEERTGLIAAVLYTSSFYCSIIVGTFILPDTPQIFFWLLTMLTFIKFYQSEIKSNKYNILLLLIGFLIGLGMISKYHSAFLWFGFILFCLFKRRDVFKSHYFYLALIITAITLTPVIYWNVCNHFISFTYHSERISLFSEFRYDYLLTEIVGEIAYTNPLNFAMTLIALLAYFINRRLHKNQEILNLYSWIALPMIGAFVMFSCFRQTLPHWTGPAYMTLIPLTASYINDKINIFPKYKYIPYINLIFFTVIIVILLFQVNYGIIKLDDNHQVTKLGKSDPTLDMYGWDQIYNNFEKIYTNDMMSGIFHKKPVIVSFRWFPAANLDYYVASPLQLKLIALGQLDNIHKYYWINYIRGGINRGDDAYFLCTSRDFKDPNTLYKNCFENIYSPDTLNIVRGNSIAYKLFIYRMISYKGNYQ